MGQPATRQCHPPLAQKMLGCEHTREVSGRTWLGPTQKYPCTRGLGRVRLPGHSISKATGLTSRNPEKVCKGRL